MDALKLIVTKLHKYAGSDDHKIYNSYLSRYFPFISYQFNYKYSRETVLKGVLNMNMRIVSNFFKECKQFLASDMIKMK